MIETRDDSPSLMATNRTGGTSGSRAGQAGLLPKNVRYRNLNDLKRKLGEDKLESFIVPEMQQITKTMREKNITVQKKKDIKDEFEQMVNWKRVFEQIWQ